MPKTATPKVLIDLRAIEITNNKLCGIYFLVYKQLIVYIGKTIDLQSRLLRHEDKQYSRVFFLQGDPEWMSAWESTYIREFKPYYNSKCNQNAFRGKPPVLDEVYDELLREQSKVDMSTHYLDDALRARGHSEKEVQFMIAQVTQRAQ